MSPFRYRFSAPLVRAAPRLAGSDAIDVSFDVTATAWIPTEAFSTNLVKWLNRTNLLPDPGGVIWRLLDMETDAPACFYRPRAL